MCKRLHVWSLVTVISFTHKIKGREKSKCEGSMFYLLKYKTLLIKDLNMNISNGLKFQNPAHTVTLKWMLRSVQLMHQVQQKAWEEYNIINHAKTYSTPYSQYTSGFTISENKIYFINEVQFKRTYDIMSQLSPNIGFRV